MPKFSRSTGPNSLLAALGSKARQRLNSALDTVSLVRGQVLCWPEEPIRHVYFPIDGEISLLVVDEGGMQLKVAAVGSEGLLGVPLALGARVSSVRALVQGGGSALRMTATRFQREMKRTPSMRREVYRYIHGLLNEVAQNGACSHFHGVEARLARWLLMTCDRLRTRQFHMTQEHLAGMVGVRRVSVSAAAMSLRNRRLIAYRRGNIAILDRKGLEAASCGCYRTLKNRHKLM